MNKKIEDFLKEQNLSKGQLYKIVPDQLLKEFAEFLNRERYKVDSEVDNGFFWFEK